MYNASVPAAADGRRPQLRRLEAESRPSGHGWPEAGKGRHGPSSPEDCRVEEAWRLLRSVAQDSPEKGTVQRLLAGASLTPGVAKALKYLSSAEPTSMRELASAMRCDTSYVTAVVDALEDKGMACRNRHPSDRRKREVVLTEKGMALAGEVTLLLDRPPRSLARLDDHEIETLVELLRKLEPEPRERPA